MTASEAQATTASMPRRVTVAVIALGTVTAGVAYASSNHRIAVDGTDWLLLIPFIGLVMVAESLHVRFKINGQTEAFNLLEAVLAPLVFAFIGPMAMGVAFVGQLLAGAYHRNSPLKVAFNAISWALAVGVSSIAFHVLAEGTNLTLQNLGALIVAMITMGLINQFALTLIIALAQRSSLRSVMKNLSPVIVPGWLIAWGFNTLIGLLFVFAYSSTAIASLLFYVPLAVLHAAYRGYASTQSDRARMAGLHRASRILSKSTGSDDAIARFLAEVCRSFEARRAELILLEDDGILVHSVDESDSSLYKKFVDHQGPQGLRCRLLTVENAARFDTHDSDDELGNALAEGAWRDCLVAALPANGSVAGVLVVFDQEGLQGFAEGERAILEALARETASSFEKGTLVATLVNERREVQQLKEDNDRLAELEAAQRERVLQLQESLQPTQPAVKQAEFGVHYLPSDDTSPTGGDFYDWQVLPNGDVHIAVVDVLGHGVEATNDAFAVVHTLRTLAFQGEPVADLVRSADAILSSVNPGLVATVIVAHYTPTTGDVIMAGGGHPPALLVQEDGTVTEVAAPGIAVGWPTAGSEFAVSLNLKPSDSLVLYTDGLIEADRDILLGLEALARNAVELRHADVNEMALELVQRSLAEAARRDDTLALVLRHTASQVTTPNVLVCRGEPASPEIPSMRRTFKTWANDLNLDTEVIDDLAVAVSELTTNAMRSATHYIELRVELDGPTLILEVEDDGPGFDGYAQIRRTASPDDEHGRGLAIVSALVDDVEFKTTSEACTVRLRKLGVRSDVDEEPSRAAKSKSSP